MFSQPSTDPLHMLFGRPVTSILYLLSSITLGHVQCNMINRREHWIFNKMYRLICENRNTIYKRGEEPSIALSYFNI